MKRLFAVLLLCCGLAFSGCAGAPKSPLPEDDPVLFIPEAGRETPREFAGIRAQKVGVIPARAGEVRADSILRLSNADGDFADVFVYGEEYELEAATIGGMAAYRVESWGEVDGRPYGALSYAFPGGVVVDVYDGLDPEIRHEEAGALFELYWAYDDMEAHCRTLVGPRRVRELILGGNEGDHVYRDWSRLEPASARYLGGEREGDDWFILTFEGVDGKSFQLPLPGSRRHLLPLLTALKGQPVTLVRGYGRVDAGKRRYAGPLLYGVSALPPGERPEPAPPETASENPGE